MLKPELLVPLNNWKSLNLKLGVLNNADSFYFGLKSNFSMRARAGNFSTDSLPKLTRLVHDFGKKIFLCTNIVLYDEELEELQQIIGLALSSEVDAVICHDIAAITIAKEIGMKFHISTQCNVSNVKTASFYKKMGAHRINLSRELNLKQIENIAEKVSIPIEIFIHGAMCTSISGRCYLSSELMNYDPKYSANRGKCIQPCRRMYRLMGEEGEEIQYEPNIGMFFNAKDLCMIEHLDKLAKLNIAAFKIEGRMRDPLYIAETASCYREAIDSISEGTYTNQKVGIWIKRLNKVYNRGFHTGFFFQQPSQDEIETKIRGNVSPYRREHVGKVIGYDYESKKVTLEIYKGIVKAGQDIIFEDDKDFFLKDCVEKIIFQNEILKESPMASPKAHVNIDIEINSIIPPNSKVYLITFHQN